MFPRSRSRMLNKCIYFNIFLQKVLYVIQKKQTDIQVLSRQTPSYLANNCCLIANAHSGRLHSANRPTCTLLVSHTCVNFRQAFSAAGPRTWNYLPANLSQPRLFVQLIQTVSEDYLCSRTKMQCKPPSAVLLIYFYLLKLFTGQAIRLPKGGQGHSQCYRASRQPLTHTFSLCHVKRSCHQAPLHFLSWRYTIFTIVLYCYIVSATDPYMHLHSGNFVLQ